MSRIVFDDEYVIVVPSFKEVLPHKHSFYHLFWVGDNAEQLYVVGEKMRHIMPPLPKCKLFLMIDPTSVVAEKIDTLLENGKPKTIDLVHNLELKECSDEELRQLVRENLIQNGLLQEHNSKDFEDYRIVKLINELKEYKHLEESIQDIADQYGLSDSRLSHIFKDCMGISLKGYLNIKQMQYAYKLIMSGEAITYSALEAGFSSPAHLAAICKKQMGISISMVLKK